jgi:hypothetical protein
MAPANIEDLTPVHPLVRVAAGCVAVGWAWWLFWLYRRHQQLAKLTNSSYPIGPGRAVGFHFVPLFNLYWAFHWTRPLTLFCDLAESGLIKRAAPQQSEGPGKPATLFAGDLSRVSSGVKPGWVPGAFLSLAMVLAYGALIPRGFLLRTFGVAPSALIDYLGALVIALGVATLLDRRLVSGVALATQSSNPPASKSTLGI